VTDISVQQDKIYTKFNFSPKLALEIKSSEPEKDSPFVNATYNLFTRNITSYRTQASMTDWWAFSVSLQPYQYWELKDLRRATSFAENWC